MSWHTSVAEAINTGHPEDIDRAIQFYEKLTETEPLTLSHYWYLGLAYLLGGREEAAKTTWLFILGQAETAAIEDWTEELATTLDQEAHRQEMLGHLPVSCLIRRHIYEINPNHLDNLLRLIELEMQIGHFCIEKLRDRSVFEVLQQETKEGIPLDLWLNVVENILDYSAPEVIAFLTLSFEKLPTEKILNKVIDKIEIIARKNEKFAIEILKICLEASPNSIFLLKQLSIYCLNIKDYRSAIDYALKMRDFYAELPLSMRAYIESHILFTKMYSADWININLFVDQYKQALWKTLDAGECPRFVQDRTLTVNIPLLYLEDNLPETRLIYNRTGELFQAWVRETLPRSSKSKRLSKQEETLKIGYIAHTLNNHSIGLITRWLMHYHDNQKFQISLYLVNQIEDAITKMWFRDKIKTCYNLPHNALTIADQIESDNIDILVDLDSITGHHTSQVMALKPAPIQVTWLGFDASGIPAIDYLLADAYVLPENAQQHYRETIWRLPDCYIAVDGVESAYATLRRDELNLTSDAIVYVTVQTGLKRNPDHIRLQNKILREVPNSYLLVQGLGDERAIKDLFCQIALEEGVNPDRLRFLPAYSTGIYRTNLRVADVVLDTYPFSGGMTTLDVLWMGIPIVTKVGQQWASRNSYTLMLNAGITEGIAWNDEEYIDWGIKLGTDRQLRRKVIAKIEASYRQSPIWNARQFTRNVEDAYRQMWRNHN